MVSTRCHRHRDARATYWLTLVLRRRQDGMVVKLMDSLPLCTYCRVRRARSAWRKPLLVLQLHHSRLLLHNALPSLGIYWRPAARR